MKKLLAWLRKDRPKSEVSDEAFREHVRQIQQQALRRLLPIEEEVLLIARRKRG